MSNSITRNTAWMTVASIGQKLISFVYFTLIARSLGPEDVGKYFLALSMSSIFVVFVDFGFTNVLIREVAKAKEKTQSYLSTTLGAKFLFGIISYGALISVAYLLYPERQIMSLVYVAGITMFFDSIHLSLYGILRAYGDLRYEAVAMTMSQLFTLIIGSTFLYFRLPLFFLIVAFAVPSICNVLFATWVLHTRHHIKNIARIDSGLFRHILRMSIPFSLAAIFARVYGYIDSILLSHLIDTTAVGWYSIAYKVTYAFQFVPLALVAALYPRFSEYYATDKQKLAKLFEQAIVYVTLVACPIAVGIAILAKDMILLVYGPTYLPSVVPLQILILSLIFSFASFPIGSLLNASHKQSTQTAIVGCVMLLNIALNVVLIPVYAMTGAAIAAFVGNCCLALAGYFFVSRLIPVSQNYLFRQVGSVAVATMGMGIVVWTVNRHFQLKYIVEPTIWPVFELVLLFVPIVAGAAAYGALLFVTGVANANRFQFAKELFKRK